VSICQSPMALTKEVIIPITSVTRTHLANGRGKWNAHERDQAYSGSHLIVHPYPERGITRSTAFRCIRIN
jgi:hypothetical protein